MLRVTTAASDTPSFWTSAQITSTIRPRLSDGVAGDDARILEMSEELADEGQRLATGAPGALWYQGYTERIILDNPTTRLYLQARPVAAVTTVQYDTDTALDEGTDADEFTIYPDSLYREDGWDTGAPGWSVVYLAGYWLPSMGASPPSTISDFVDAGGHDRRALHLRRAIWKALQVTWAGDRNEDPSIKARGAARSSVQYFGSDAGQAIMPPAAAAIFIQEGASRRIG